MVIGCQRDVIQDRLVDQGYYNNMVAYDIKDPRGVEVVGDKLYIGDGDDTRTDDLKHAVYVFDLP